MTHYSNTPNPVDFPKLSTVDRLWGEALDRAVPDTYSSLTWTQVEKIKTVFAELIVKECISLCEEVDDINKTYLEVRHIDPEFGPKECIKVIKTYFGVEQ